MDSEEVLKLRALKKELNARWEFQDCMRGRLDEMMGWKTKQNILTWSNQDAFEWKEMLLAKGICKDRNECYCEILLAPNQEFEQDLLDNKKTVDQAKEEEEKNEM